VQFNELPSLAAPLGHLCPILLGLALHRRRLGDTDDTKRYRGYKKRNRRETEGVYPSNDDECRDGKLNQWRTISKTEARRIVHG
jgi:hypothetical protein